MKNDIYNKTQDTLDKPSPTTGTTDTVVTTCTIGSVDIRKAIFGRNTQEKEVSLLISVNDATLDFRQQLSAVASACQLIRKEEQVETVFSRFFLSDIATQTPEVMSLLLEDRGYAVSLVQQPPCNGTKIALWSYMKSGVKSEPVGEMLYKVESSLCTQFWTGNLEAAGANSKDQTSRILERYVMELLGQGMTLEANCMRTWFFVHDIDFNYSGMVKARNDFFQTQGLTDDTHFIASTGIGGRGIGSRSMVSMDAVAFKGINKEQVKYLYATENMNRTSDYGVSFERGTAVRLADRTQVFLSGTASIDSHGQIMYPNDVILQAGRMADNVRTLLHEADCDMKDILQALVYLRDPADYQRVDNWLRTQFPTLPYLLLHAPVCRQGWLIEMECMAVRHNIPEHKQA